ncbi:MAG: hypothetical protein QM772_11730 [Ottowia sp.]|uniref:hypothetical protein n=1 Tax=Ottowia sp. TaxID=1898956 RepID=UPI0039E4100A
MLRTIGFVGIVLLAMLDTLVLYVAVSEKKWGGIAVGLLFAGLLMFFARVLWLGAKAARDPASAPPLAAGWDGQPLSVFFREQVSKSLEGRVLIVGSIASLLTAAASVFWPSILPYQRTPEAVAVLFAMWPVLAFVAYVRICGPNYASSAIKFIAMVAVVAAPFALAAR